VLVDLSFSLTALSFPREIEVLAGLIRTVAVFRAFMVWPVSPPPDMSQTVVSDCAAELPQYGPDRSVAARCIWKSHQAEHIGKDVTSHL
jgi:hypothetical protein